ncbi:MULTISPECIES: DUF6261 family protein [unclassified Parabacteroides]|uniref:DUF6261 family protein n=1 Tax=unclassified Parabacteroides TaxID=2649774 RepID=UPI002476343A|nr:MULTISPECIES: DUF6261 family protein [unclassified Parabacteroides]
MEKIADAKLQPILRNFADAIISYDVALKSIPNNQLVEKMAVENENRLKAYQAIRTQENEQLGKKIEDILAVYDDPAHLNDEEKTELLNKIIADLETKLDETDFEEKEFFDSLSLLKCANWAYAQYINLHKIDLTGKCLTYETLKSRKQAENAYYHTVKFINAMLIYNGDSEYADLIDDINHLIDSTEVNPVFDVRKVVPA